MGCEEPHCRVRCGAGFAEFDGGICAVPGTHKQIYEKLLEKEGSAYTAEHSAKGIRGSL